jgi:allophanate hydrolase
MTMQTTDLDLSIGGLRARYLAGGLKPSDLVRAIRERIAGPVPGPVWIRLLDESELAPYLARLESADPASLPLYGIPFAIKDNIDLAGIPTTAACPDFAYVPARSAFAVERLIAAGAIPIGKTNLDQFATGLVGTRSPHGATPNAFDPEYIAGGSSSGSAVAVASGLASFALGTDTAGSGRVPAAFNNLVGIKPTRGLISCTGVVPACRTLDCVTVFALDLADARSALAVAVGFDPEDPYSRAAPAPAQAPESAGEGGAFRFGVPRSPQFFGDGASESMFAATVQRLRALGGTLVPLDFDPFEETARLLYEGPWVAERYAAIQGFIESRPQALLDVTRAIVEPAGQARAVDAFKAQYRLAALKRRADAALEGLDFALTPTAPTIYRIAEIQADPIALNSRLGTYTNFMNLLDLAAVAVPAGFRPDGLPFGVTLFGPAFSDARLAGFAERLHRAQGLTLGATGRPMARSPAGEPVPAPPESAPQAACQAASRAGAILNLAVCGAHLSGLPLNHQLTARGARLVRATRTAPSYRLYALPGGPPHRPGLIRQLEGGAAIELEVWSVPLDQVGSFLAGIPAPLGLGTLELEDGTWEKGFICEGHAAQGARDITSLGGWRAFLAAAN